MSIFSAENRAFAESLSRIVYANPFLPERVELERHALGELFDPSPPVWSMRVDRLDEQPNLVRLGERAVEVACAVREALQNGSKPSADEGRLYEDLAAYALYHTYRSHIYELITKHEHDDAGAGSMPVAFWVEFRRDFASYFELPGHAFEIGEDPGHLLALCFQIRRAFHNIFYYVVGGSLPAARLRGQIWQSVFTHNLRRYRQTLYRTIGDVTTLVTGPSGTGKELVARAIALSRYIPFDAAGKAFRGQLAGTFLPLNLSALSPTLIESELFGHCRGAFTGATTDHQGWLEVCSDLGTVFLDEIGDLDAAIQVKLLRVLQTRVFQRLGETEPRHFAGKIVAATNRDLATEMQAVRFRPDLYYRLCADRVVTPSLAEQLADAPEDLPHLVRYVAHFVAGDAADELAAEVVEWIDTHLGRHYTWPGNFRELEQCVRNIMIRGEYRPVGSQSGPAVPDALGRVLEQFRAGQLTTDELLSTYTTFVYAQERNYQAAARRLGTDRRTVKARIDQRLLDELEK